MMPWHSNVPSPAAIVINSGVNKEKSPNAPKDAEKVEDLLGQPSGKFDYKVFYSKPPSDDIPIKSIVPIGWGDEFVDKDNKGYNAWIDNTEMNHGHQE